jgi:hypothetical protein
MTPSTETTPTQTPEERLNQLLLERGLLEKITPPMRPEEYPRDRVLIVLEGKPLSEFIIEERR